MKKVFYIAAILAAVVTTSLPVVSAEAVASENAAHMMFGIFFKEGDPNFKYPAQIKGEDIIGPLRGKAEYLIVAHSAALKDGDVISLQNDLLRNGDAGMDDLGVNCQLTVHTGIWSVGGKCDVFLPALHEQKSTGIIPPTTIEGDLIWYNVWTDPATGVAVYVLRETGAVIGK